MACAAILLLTDAATGQQQFAELGKHHLPRDADTTNAIKLADVDRDGDLDLVVGNSGLTAGAQQDRLYLNDGGGIYTDVTGANLPVDTDNTRDVALADVDRDGDLDLVCANVNSQNRLYLNNGGGVFTDGTSSRMPTDFDPTLAVAIGDVDRDGDLDMVFGNARQDRLYLNDGTGHFTDVTASHLPIDSANTMAVVFGDVDRDGDLDLVLANSGQQNSLYLNDGTGRFTNVSSIRLPPDLESTVDAAVGDVDQDGDLDLLMVNFGQQNRLYRNDGFGTFTDATAGRLPPDADLSRAGVLADVDRDGDLDALIGNSGSTGNRFSFQDRLYVNDGTGRFSDVTAARLPTDTAPTESLAFGDVDGDGDGDVMLGNSGVASYGWNRLYVNHQGRFVDAMAERLPTDADRTAAVAIADVDADGDLDVVLAKPTKQTRLHLNDSDGNFAEAASRMPTDSAITVALMFGDVDADGDSDLVLGRYTQPSALYLNDGAGRFTDASAFSLPPNADATTSLALGDVDRDGDADLIVGNLRQQNRLYLNNGSGRFTDATLRLPPDTDLTNAVAIGDVDGDLDLDLVIGNSGPNRLYLNDGTGTFLDGSATHLPPDNDYTRTLALADVEGDGDLDLVIGNGSQRTRLYLNAGNGVFTDATASRLPSDSESTAAIAVVDVDGDGDRDLVLVKSGQNRLFENDGTGNFTDATIPRLPLGSNSGEALAAGDLDGDGDPDLVVGYYSSSTILFNLLRQLDAPYLPILRHRYQLDVYARYGIPRQSDRASIYLSPVRVHISLPPYGILGLDPRNLISLGSVTVPPATGVASISFTVPNVPQLLGVPFYSQALLVQSPSLTVLTQVAGDVLR